MNAKKVMLFTPRATRRRGQILIMTLLGLTVLVGMVFYLFNVGTQVNRRVELQHAADSAAISGTAWMARSMNTVAMNNMGQVKLLTNSIILDSMPLATEMSYNELKGWDQAVLAQLGAGVPNRNSEGWLIEEALQNIHAKINQQSEILADMDRALNHSGFKMDQTTHWRVDGQDNSGHLWQAMAGLQGFSEVTVSTCGALAQSNAVRWGTSGHTDVAFLTPILPVMPASLGNFLDFAPLMVGFEQIGNDGAVVDGKVLNGAGGAIPDMVYPYRLGPFARLLHWRDEQYKVIPATWVPPVGTPPHYVQDTPPKWVSGNPEPVIPGDNVSGIPGDGGRETGTSQPPLHAGSGGDGGGHYEGGTGHWEGDGTPGHFEGGGKVDMGYTTYGPVRPALEYVSAWASAKLSYPHFAQYEAQIARVKLSYMFAINPVLQKIRKPDWKSLYPDAKQAATDGKHTPRETLYYVVRIYSKVPEGASGWLQPGNFWSNVHDPQVVNNTTTIPLSCWYDGWVDMDNPPGPPVLPALKWTRVKNYVWKASSTGQTTSLREAGILPKKNDKGGYELQTVYFVEYRVFGGLDVGADVEISNPYNWKSWNEGQPRPMMLNTVYVDQGFT